MEPSNPVAHAQKLIDLALRYVGSGGAAILAFGAVQTPAFAFLHVSGGAAGSDLSSWLILLYVVIVGPAIYAIHRTILHPVVLGCILYFCKRRLAPEFTVRDLDVRMAEYLATERAQSAPWTASNDAWTAQVHFLYCASWGIALAFGLHYLIDAALFNKHATIGIAVCLILLVPAIVSDRRLNVWQLERMSADGGLTLKD